jgi:hypothetical protein
LLVRRAGLDMLVDPLRPVPQIDHAERPARPTGHSDGEKLMLMSRYFST